MGRTYYFCRNERDFFKWCRRYVRRAQQFIESYESDKGEFSRMLGEEEYRESVKIVRQYQVLLSSLPKEQQRFLDEYLIDNRDYPIFKPPYNRYTHIIYENWEQICFPQNISRIKTIDRVQLGKTIRMMRENQGLSRRQVAELLQINDKTLAAYENGERLVKTDVLYGMSQIYKTSMDLIIEKSMPVFLIIKKSSN